ncbi:hypothetical protein [Oceanicoccus sagamiensis]|uniref:hypothetical protein n=1 Tax=Oceanicoccus sagamiensis TaxID=716816 RepID=UPI0012F4B985|nr:hypothetical protein [Oceanicoccus sagamiensis]
MAKSTDMEGDAGLLNTGITWRAIVRKSGPTVHHNRVLKTTKFTHHKPADTTVKYFWLLLYLVDRTTTISQQPINNPMLINRLFFHRLTCNTSKKIKKNISLASYISVFID